MRYSRAPGFSESDLKEDERMPITFETQDDLSDEIIELKDIGVRTFKFLLEAYAEWIESAKEYISLIEKTFSKINHHTDGIIQFEDRLGSILEEYDELEVMLTTFERAMSEEGGSRSVSLELLQEKLLLLANRLEPVLNSDNSPDDLDLYLDLELEIEIEHQVRHLMQDAKQKQQKDQSHSLLKMLDQDMVTAFEKELQLVREAQVSEAKLYSKTNETLLEKCVFKKGLAQDVTKIFDKVVEIFQGAQEKDDILLTQLDVKYHQASKQFFMSVKAEMTRAVNDFAYKFKPRIMGLTSDKKNDKALGELYHWLNELFQKKTNEVSSSQGLYALFNQIIEKVEDWKNTTEETAEAKSIKRIMGEFETDIKRRFQMLQSESLQQFEIEISDLDMKYRAEIDSAKQLISGALAATQSPVDLEGSIDPGSSVELGSPIDSRSSVDSSRSPIDLESSVRTAPHLVDNNSTPRSYEGQSSSPLVSLSMFGRGFTPAEKKLPDLKEIKDAVKSYLEKNRGGTTIPEFTITKTSSLQNPHAAEYQLSFDTQTAAREFSEYLSATEVIKKHDESNIMSTPDKKSYCIILSASEVNAILNPSVLENVNRASNS